MVKAHQRPSRPPPSPSRVRLGGQRESVTKSLANMQKQESERFNPMAKAPSTPTGPTVPRTAASVLQMAGRDDASKWQDRAGLSPSPEEELEEVKIENEPVEPAAEVIEQADAGLGRPTENMDVDTASQDQAAAPEPESDLEDTKPTRRTRGAVNATATPGTPKIMLRFSSPATKPAKNTRSKAKPNGRTRGRKRKASESEDEAEESEQEEPVPKRRSRAAPPPPVEGLRRSLRSRAPKNEEQQRLEEEKRARMRAALASDDEAEDED